MPVIPFGHLSMLKRLALAVGLLSLVTACSRPSSALAIGAAAPMFSLPGVDGRVHGLADYAASPVLAVVFTCNRCPAAQRSEARLKALVRDYATRGVAVVAINPNPPEASRFVDLAYTDVGESLEDMKTRAEFAGIEYLYLSDGESQVVSRQFGVVTTPQVFVFDRARTLRYQGRLDDDGPSAAAGDVRAAIDALLAGQAVKVAQTTPVGCPVLGPADAVQAGDERKAIAGERVAIDAANAETLTALRRNGTGKLLLVNFWATWCGPCVTEFPDLEATWRMFRTRGLEFVAVSTNDPQERPAVVEFLEKHHASHRNLQFATPDVYGLQAAFDPKMPASLPFTLLIADNGDVLYQELGASDIPKLRRAILAHLPEDTTSEGQRAYWSRR